MFDLLQFLNIDIPPEWLLIGGALVGVIALLLLQNILSRTARFVNRHWRGLLVCAAIVGAIGLWR